MFNDFNDDVWDEHQWEAHLNEIEKQTTHLRKFIAPDPLNSTPRWLTLLRESQDELDAVDAFIREELEFNDPYFDEEDDYYTEWEEDDDIDESFPEEWNTEESDLEEEDFDAGEEWKALSDEFARTENGSIEMLDIYDDARSLSALILQWAETLNPEHINEDCNNFVGRILKIGAKIAGGYSFGFDLEFLGGNIAYTKKALYYANDGLTILQKHLKEAPFLTTKQYFSFHQQLFELRNNIGIYIQELREEFNMGFE
ncbi:hypothetical protein J6I44_08535 [Aliifodinibius sp. 1BSP15-2V2]|uniref:Uncharacterized protein n=2 Tax=Fodinibius salsisoli TaxID=2820877 RepID=A0ABT3PLX2_9BACT|nr:hypothetical protein [Fodinibius salsisoli]